MRRADRERNFDFAVEVIKNAPYANVAFTGDAYAVPLSPIFMDGHIYFHCASEGEKLERIKKDPRVCITAVSQCDPKPGRFGVDYKSAIFFAEAEIVTDPDEKFRALMTIAETHAPTLPDRMEKYARFFIDRAVVLRMNILSGTGKECIKK